MKELKFDIYAMAKPRTPKDILALLREIRAELASLQGHFDAAGKACSADLESAVQA